MRKVRDFNKDNLAEEEESLLKGKENEGPPSEEI
jgi:hypothetical protein